MGPSEEVTDEQMLAELAGASGPELPAAPPSSPPAPEQPAPPAPPAEQAPAPAAKAPQELDPVEKGYRSVQRNFDQERKRANSLKQQLANVQGQLQAANQQLAAQQVQPAQTAQPTPAQPPVPAIPDSARAKLAKMENDLGIESGELQGVFEAVVAPVDRAGTPGPAQPPPPPPGQPADPLILQEVQNLKTEVFGLRLQADGPNRDSEDLLRIAESIEDQGIIGVGAEEILDEVHQAQSVGLAKELPPVLAFSPQFRATQIDLALARRAAVAQANAAVAGAGAPPAPVAPGRTDGSTNPSGGIANDPAPGQEAEALRNAGQGSSLDDAAGSDYQFLDTGP